MEDPLTYYNIFDFAVYNEKDAKYDCCSAFRSKMIHRNPANQNEWCVVEKYKYENKDVLVFLP